MWSSGKNLGGSSNLNYMGFTRSIYHDYDNWANYTGDPRWSYKNVLTYFKEYEFWDDPSIADTARYHGDKGKIRTAYSPHTPVTIADMLVQAGVEHGLNRLSDINLPFDDNGIHIHIQCKVQLFT